MSALRRLSVSISSRRNSLFERSQHSVEPEDEAKVVLDEAKAFIRQQASDDQGASQEEMKMLRFLCDMLDTSLNMAQQQNEKSARINIKQQAECENANREQQQRQNITNNNNNDNNTYKTWAAGGVQRQKQRKLQLMAKQGIGAAASTVDTISPIHEEEHEHPAAGSSTCGIGGEEEGTETAGTTMEKDANLGEMQESIELPATTFTYQEPEPLLVSLLPHVALVLSVVSYLFLGCVIFRLIDPEIGSKSWPRAFIWAFQLLATIGWGDSRASTTLSQAFTVAYIVLGIPMLFSAYANFGRALTEFCCRKGLLIWTKMFGEKKQKGEDEEELADVQRLPLIIIVNLLIVHECFGLLIYSVWLKDWPVISTVYFSITTLATSGFGDFHPDTDSWLETVVAVLYISAGIVLLSALFLTIALYYQTLHYVQLKELLSRLQQRWKRGHKVGGGKAEAAAVSTDVEKQSAGQRR